MPAKADIDEELVFAVGIVGRTLVGGFLPKQAITTNAIKEKVFSNCDKCDIWG